MLKGSGFYELSDKVGYPPLSNFIVLGKSNKPPVNFNYASLPVLRALFGDKVASAIMSMEQSKSEIHGGRKILTKAELNTLLSGSLSKRDQSSQIEQMLSFSKKTIVLDNLVYKNKDKRILFTLPSRRLGSLCKRDRHRECGSRAYY
jgi:replicative DNA helicase